ncbi:MAG: YIP1 family protein [Nitrospirota bacterium]|nr:YIP1 family protein [Nitrospirota bacterium]
MNLLFKNIKLFFTHPKSLFSALRETPGFKRALILLFILASSFVLPNIKSLLSKYPDAILMTDALIMTSILVTGLLFVGLLLGSSYVLILCRLLGRKPKFTAILSALIYCGIPSMFGMIFYTLLPVRTYLLSIFPIEKLHPFLISVFQEVDLFWLWTTAMEIIAVAIISGLSYRKSFTIIISYWIVRSIIIYLLGINMGEIYRGVLPIF